MLIEGRRGDGADRAQWAMKGGGGRLAKGRISTGKEKGDHFATWIIGPYEKRTEKNLCPFALLFVFCFDLLDNFGKLFAHFGVDCGDIAHGFL